jgi:SpoIID/LytB domain protein
MKRIFLLFVLLVVIVMPTFFILAKEVGQMTLEEVQQELANSQKTLSGKNYDKQEMTKKLNGINGRVDELGQEIVKKEDEVEKGEEALDYQKKLLNERVNSYYKNSNHTPYNLMSVLFSGNLSDSLRDFFYQESIVDKDKDTIIKVVMYIKNLEEIKSQLTAEKSQLSALKQEVDRQLLALQSEISQIEQKISQLSTRQSELIAAKLASVPVPRSAETSLGGCKSDIDVDPGFGSRYALFSFGVPNKIGLNQYGAKGRAESGQNYETILRAYYNFDSLQDGANAEIKVNDGNGINQGNIIWTGNLEEYAKRIYEMPGDWHGEALKAQVIAARSYALAATGNGANTICANENCQVFRDQVKTGGWEQAVNDTSGKIMVQGGSAIKSWFSSTHGGVILSSSEIGWSGTTWTKHGIDTPSGDSSDFSNLRSNAYDRSSPWFYCDWGYRAQNNNTAWLRQEEMLDIINAFFLYKKDNSALLHLSQADGGVPDTWSQDKVRQELQKYESPASSVDIGVSWDGSGISRTVNINGRSFDAQEFKNFFNMRAPANIQIKPACRPTDTNLSNDCPHALYNVEKR